MSPPAFPSRFCCCRRVSVLQARLVAPGAPGFQRCASVPSACALQAVVLSLAGLGTLAEAVLTPEQRQTLPEVAPVYAVGGHPAPLSRLPLLPSPLSLNVDRLSLVQASVFSRTLFSLLTETRLSRSITLRQAQ